MKTIQIFTGKLCLYVSMLFIPLFSNSQQIGDTITIYIENRVEMSIAVYDFDNLRQPNDLVTNIKNFQSYLPQLSGQLNKESSELVIYIPDSILSVENKNPKNIFLIQGDKAVNTGIRDKVIIHNNESRVTLITSDLNNLKDLPLADCYQKMLALLPEKTRQSRSIYFQCKEGEVIELKEKSSTDGQLDALELSFGAGAGLVKNQWIGDFNLRLGIILNKKGKLDHYPYISASLLYDFPTGNKTNINTFVNLGYGWNISEEKDRRMMGFELGYLTSRQGNLFEDNTFRLSLNWSSHLGVKLSPQMYFVGGFEKAYPGIRVGFGF